MSLTANQLIEGYYSSNSNEAKTGIKHFPYHHRRKDNRGFNDQGIDVTEVVGTSL